MITPTIETPRLILRGGKPSDFEPFCAAMADAAFARFITREKRPLTPAECWTRLCSMTGNWQVRGYGMFSVEEKASGAFIGMVGPWEPFGWPEFEVGWSIFPQYQGHGFAPEAAAASLRFAHDVLGKSDAIHCIHPDNEPSARVARSLGAQPGEMWMPFWDDAEAVRLWRTSRESFLASPAFARL